MKLINVTIYFNHKPVQLATFIGYFIFSPFFFKCQHKYLYNKPILLQGKQQQICCHEKNQSIPTVPTFSQLQHPYSVSINKNRMQQTNERAIVFSGALFSLQAKVGFPLKSQLQIKCHYPMRSFFIIFPIYICVGLSTV